MDSYLKYFPLSSSGDESRKARSFLDGESRRSRPTLRPDQVLRLARADGWKPLRLQSSGAYLNTCKIMYFWIA